MVYLAWVCFVLFVFCFNYFFITEVVKCDQDCGASHMRAGLHPAFLDVFFKPRVYTAFAIIEIDTREPQKAIHLIRVCCETENRVLPELSVHFLEGSS